MASDRLRRDRAETIVVLDSSSILMVFEFSIDLEDELKRLLGRYKILVPKPIYDELVFLSINGKGKKKLIAKPALELIKNYEISNAMGLADDSVIYLANKNKGVVLTNDRDIRKKAKEKHLQTIYLRGKSKLVLE